MTREDPRLSEPITIAAIDVELAKADAAADAASEAFNTASMHLDEVSERRQQLRNARQALVKVLGLVTP